jgi:hypothetical protein
VDLLPLGQGCNFRGDISRSSTSIEDVIFGAGVGRKAKIDDNGLKATLASHHYVLRLDIPMHDAVIVDLFQSLRESDHKLLDFP